MLIWMDMAWTKPGDIYDNQQQNWLGKSYLSLMDFLQPLYNTAKVTNQYVDVM